MIGKADKMRWPETTRRLLACARALLVRASAEARARFRRAATLALFKYAADALARFKRAAAEPLAPHLDLGRRGELLAADLLRARGFELVAANFRVGVGRNRRGALVQAEIDLIAYEGATLCFVEVKTRASDRFAAPEANVDLRKQRQITRAARAYRRAFGLAAAPYRYDVVSALLPPPLVDGHAPAPRLELLRNFWTEEKFRKRRWSQNT